MALDSLFELQHFAQLVFHHSTGEDRLHGTDSSPFIAWCPIVTHPSSVFSVFPGLRLSWLRTFPTIIGFGTFVRKRCFTGSENQFRRFDGVLKTSWSLSRNTMLDVRRETNEQPDASNMSIKLREDSLSQCVNLTPSKTGDLAKIEDRIGHVASTVLEMRYRSRSGEIG